LPPDGGFQKFQSENLDKRSYALALQQQGYRTSMMGKYLNGYGDPMRGATDPVPPGWSDWHVSNSSGYAEFNFELNDNGKVNRYKGQDNYGVDVLTTKAQSFIQQSGDKPFALEVATFAPHAPYTPAPRNAEDFPGLTQPRDPSYNALDTNSPTWLGQRKALDAKQQTAQRPGLPQAGPGRRGRRQAAGRRREDAGGKAPDRQDLHRVQLRQRLPPGPAPPEPGQADGLRHRHPGAAHHVRTGGGQGQDVVRGGAEHRPVPDLRGPGRREAGAVEDHSLVPLLHPTSVPVPWRSVALIEHQGMNTNPADPDHEGGGSDPTTYEAIRISAKSMPGFTGPVEAVYVEYQSAQHELEYYDLATDPYELDNIAGQLTDAQKAELHRLLTGLVGCHDGPTCFQAASRG